MTEPNKKPSEAELVSTEIARMTEFSDKVNLGDIASVQAGHLERKLRILLDKTKDQKKTADKSLIKMRDELTDMIPKEGEKCVAEFADQIRHGVTALDIHDGVVFQVQISGVQYYSGREKAKDLMDQPKLGVDLRIVPTISTDDKKRAIINDSRGAPIVFGGSITIKRYFPCPQVILDHIKKQLELEDHIAELNDRIVEISRQLTQMGKTEKVLRTGLIEARMGQSEGGKAVLRAMDESTNRLLPDVAKLLELKDDDDNS